MTNTLKEYSEKIKLSTTTEDTNYNINLQKIIAFQLYGFSAQALIDKNISVAETAFNIASEYLPKSEYDKIFLERVGPNGEMKWSLDYLSSNSKYDRDSWSSLQN